MQSPLALLVLACSLVASTASASAWTDHTGGRQATAEAAGTHAFYQECGRPHRGLETIASDILRARLRQKQPPTPAAIRAMVHMQGVPHLHPRAWLHSVRDDSTALKALRAWQARHPNTEGEARCGVARGTDRKGVKLVALVTLKATAELALLPRKVRPSQWLRLKAKSLTDFAQAKVLLLGPRGRPRRVLASMSGGVLRSRFTLDQPGRWLVQVVGLMPDGPRPVLEAVVFAGTDPRNVAQPRAKLPEGTPVQQLLFLLNQERKREGLPALTRSKKLEMVAVAHARAMKKARKARHNVGNGSPADRARRAGLRDRIVGENVAAAGSVWRIHQAWWDSPSHRENILDRRFRRVGIGLAESKTGRLFSAELFGSSHARRR